MSSKKSAIDVGTGGLAKIVGGKGADTVYVFDEKNIDFDGRGGADTLVLRDQFGNSVGAGNSVVDLAAGTGQNPYGSGNFTLKNVENVIGSSGDDELRGNAAHNRLDGGNAGFDSMWGEGGNDILIYKTPNQHLDEADGGTGIDTLIVDLTPYEVAQQQHKLDLDTPSNNTGVFENATVLNIEIFKVGDFSDAPDNYFEFVGRDDTGETVTGGNGDDKLDGRGGDDVLTGLLGKDILTGGTGKDRFVFIKIADSLVDDPDEITDFNRTEGDKIDLRPIDANIKMKGNQAFSFIGTKAFSGKAGQLRYEIVGNDVQVSGDVNGDKTADFAILVKDVADVIQGDFLL